MRRDIIFPFYDRSYFSRLEVFLFIFLFSFVFPQIYFMKEVASTLSRFDFWKIIHFANYSFLYSELSPLCRNVIPAMGKPAKEQKQLQEKILQHST